MKHPNFILEKKEILIYLRTRALLKQYIKAKYYLLAGNLVQVAFKEKKPKGSGVFSFRINKQYRALGIFNKNADLIIFKIDNHQN